MREDKLAIFFVFSKILLHLFRAVLFKVKRGGVKNPLLAILHPLAALVRRVGVFTFL
jgi:hypothetical protein